MSKKVHNPPPPNAGARPTPPPVPPLAPCKTCPARGGVDCNCDCPGYAPTPPNYDYTTAKRAADYKKRQIDKGIKRVSVQAYPADRETILEFAAKLRAARETPTLGEALDDIERACCGTFKGSRHRSTCEHFRKGDT